jgi:hypothetical protein
MQGKGIKKRGKQSERSQARSSIAEGADDEAAEQEPKRQFKSCPSFFRFFTSPQLSTHGGRTKVGDSVQ